MSNVQTASRPETETNGRPAPPLRVPLPVPEAVLKIMKERHDIKMSKAARKRLLDDYVLQYHFGGQFVARRTVPEGVEVWAVGSKDVGRLWRELSDEESLQYVGTDVDEWGGDR